MANPKLGELLSSPFPSAADGRDPTAQSRVEYWSSAGNGNGFGMGKKDWEWNMELFETGRFPTADFPQGIIFTGWNEFYFDGTKKQGEM